MCMEPKPRTPQKKVTVLGLGGSGGKIVHYLQEKGADYNLLYVDDDEQSIMESTVNTIRVADCKGKDTENLVRAIGNSEKLVVVTGLGGNFGVIAVPMVAYIAEELELDMDFILSYPAKFEGKGRKDNADLIVGLLNQFNINATIYEFDKLIDNLDRKIPMEDMFNIMNEVIYQGLNEVGIKR